ncbi:CLUMA_CG009254, isoform A [Clunio marinus]|uniref:CLUMA_CG009254, isoform A n=1 Tax=Clunio marinus TaxID=568069 RepID=A0A1J1I670_9DIPT|nr:CLUMA_CG009254, isoform A [Clunio marinus]
MSKYFNNQLRRPSVTFSDIDVNHKSNKLTRELSIVEEAENTDEKNAKLLEDYPEDQDFSSHIASDTKANTHLNTGNHHRLHDNLGETNSSSSRRPSVLLQEILSTRRPSAIMATLRRGSATVINTLRGKSDDPNDHTGAKSPEAIENRRKNRRIGDDALSTALSALYAKMIVILGIAFPITEILSNRIPQEMYQGFYVYLYLVSIIFVIFVYATQMKSKAVLTIIKSYHEKNSDVPIKKRVPHFASFYLRIGAIAFGIGNMVYSGIELGQYFELKSGDDVNNCSNIFMLLTPLGRMILSIVQMQFIFLNTTEVDMGRHKVISRFGLMHMVATNLCEWLYTLVEETKHEIYHLTHSHHGASNDHRTHENMIANTFVEHIPQNISVNSTNIDEHNIVKRSIVSSSDKYHDCQRTNIMGSLVQNASPFLFPCTIEYSLICAVILFEMWKKVRSIPEIAKTRRNSVRASHASLNVKNDYQFSIDCSKAHRGMFAGIVVIVMTIICLIMYFVLYGTPNYVHMAITEVTYYEIILYTVCSTAVLVAFFRMRDLKYQKKSGDHHADTIKLDCTLLVVAGIGVYVYGMFSIMGSSFALQDNLPGARDALISEALSLFQVSLQTLFILNSCWRRCKGSQQIREKPGRQIVTFLLVANISLWFINTLIKGHASFRPAHLEFFGQWAWVNYWTIMTRRKPMPQQECEDSKLGRGFGTFDLTALGVSATLGVGVYVLAGHVAKDQAGPSVIVSFLIAAAASFLAGLCYAEFSSRVPKSGSAYIFTYVAIGEFLAFIVGWNLILEYIIGAASISKGLSLYIDSLINDSMKNSFKQIAPISWDFLSSYFDFFAFGCPLFIGFALAFGLRKSAGINNILCILNLGIVVYVVVAVLFNADIRNWQIDPNEIPPQYNNSSAGTGGFFPFGFSGTLKGAATCFFGFVGFDCIATTGEEVRNPQKTVPRALLYSLLIIFIAYFGVSLLTLMWPYYLLNSEAPLPHAFQEIGWNTSKWIVTLGGIIGLLLSLFGAIFPLPRILYAMVGAQDGLMFREFSIISNRFQTPVIGTLCAAFLTSSFSALFDLASLVSMLSIGVLLAYTVVAISIIILRFSQSTELITANERHVETSNLLRPGYNITAKGFLMQMIRLNASRHPNTISMCVVGSLIMCYCLLSFALGLTILYSWDAIGNGETWALVSVAVLSTFLILFCILISIQPRQRFRSHLKPFKVPIVPFLPAVSVFINIYLMLMLDYYTWIRFGIWMVLGIIIYFPCAWFFNNTKRDSTTQWSDEIMRENSNNVITIIESNIGLDCDGRHKNNEGIAVKSTCETEDVIIVQEKYNTNSTSGISNGMINNKINVENEANLVIEMLDTVLEAEDEENDFTETETNDRRDSSQSINTKNCFSSQTVLTTKVFELISPEEVSSNNTTKFEIFDLNVDKSDIENEINDIIKQAMATVAEIQEQRQFNEVQTDIEDDTDENVFRNQKFLAHLNDLISKSNQ